MTDLHELDAHAMAQLLTGAEVSSVELIEHHLRRIESLDPDLHAMITVTADQALDAARLSDRKRTAGEQLAPFDGIPTALKDLDATAGVRTTMGSRIFAEEVPTVSAYAVDLVQQAGFISLGKTNTPEFGLSSYSENDLVGHTRTPWDITRNAGGSSGGAAAAVAAGLVPLALGSDGGGSIRIPASCCGVFGFKPSRGRVSPGPLGSDWNGLAVRGPISATVRDAAALLDAVASPMPGDSRPLPKPAEPFQSWASREPGRLRIARWSDPYLPQIVTSNDSVAAWEHASMVLAGLGHELIEVVNPFPPELEPQFNIIWSTGIAAAPIPKDQLELLRPTTRYWLERGRQTSGAELASALQFVEAATRTAMTALAEFDAWLTPTLALPPPPIDWFTESGDDAENHWRELQFTPFTALYNMSGMPAASLPLHVSTLADGTTLPIGVMLAGRTNDDGPLLALCAQIEQADPWIGRLHALAATLG